MASNNEYKRYFIILQEDDKGYEMAPGKIPTGYVKIEVKNNKVRLNAFVQNVKFEDRIEYRLILVASVKKLAVDIGKIIIDNSGRGELSCELESDNVLKSGLNIGDFTVAAVATGVSVPLSGYTGREKLEWKGRYDIINRQSAAEKARIDKKKELEEIVPEIPMPAAPHEQHFAEPEMPVVEEPVKEPEVIEVIPEPVKKPEVLVEVPVVEVPVKEPEMPVEIPMPVEPIPEPMPVPEPVVVVQQPVIEQTHIHESKVEIKVVIPECPPMAPMEEPCEMEEVEHEDIQQYYCEDDSDDSDSDSDSDDDRPKHHHEDHHEEHHEEHHDDSEAAPYYKSAMYNKLKRMLRRLRRYEPFEEERGYDWFRVGDDIYEINSVAVPYMGYMVPVGYPFMSEACSMMMDRKDYIIGIRYEEDDDDDRRTIRYLLFGVPAIYSKKNEQHYKSRGFMEFRQHKSKSYGYFIMCLDLRNGMLCHMD